MNQAFELRPPKSRELQGNIPASNRYLQWRYLLVGHVHVGKR